ncbi:DUF1214 domain-containing protein [Xanthobacter autotrophicus]|uniref:DUF1214 domain-containing protein n=1 Tax=Xanthobacter autotrophicus TaxID=280 RepID=UPI00372D4C18
MAGGSAAQKPEDGEPPQQRHGPRATVTLYLQATNPGKDKEADCLPPPAAGRWYLNLRAYAPCRPRFQRRSIRTSTRQLPSSR